MRTPALFADEKNIRYFAGVSRSPGYLLVTESKKYFLTSDADADSKAVSIKIQKDALKELGFLLRKLRIKKVFTPFSSISAEQLNRLKKIANLEDSSEEISAIRSVKKKEEVIKIKEACGLADEAMKAARDSIRVGVTEKRVRLEAMEAVLERCEDQAFPMIVASGANSMLTHAYPSDKKIREKETVIVDLGFTVEGYCSDLTRTFAVSPTEKQIKLYETVLRAYEESVACLKKGRKYSDIYEAAGKVFDETKTRQHWKYSLGHGVGLDVHEAPAINAKTKCRVADGNVFTIEPGLHVRDVGGCRIEDTILFYKKPVVLTRFPKVLEA
ncbi:MAG: M24 family peptidase [archaeon]